MLTVGPLLDLGTLLAVSERRGFDVVGARCPHDVPATLPTTVLAHLPASLLATGGPA
ncbi:MAG: hypothetical protein ACE37B_10310 [Ilumatobacter sp.]|jgi:hypothetical protein|uniref:hypothetical protein n=1 Tax=Ilumatobacter sp. TaxID=1967498 RepID=UPI003919AE98